MVTCAVNIARQPRTRPQRSVPLVSISPAPSRQILSASFVQIDAQILSTVSPSPAISCTLLNALCALFPTVVLCNQQLTHSFAKTPGVGGTLPCRPCEINNLQTLWSSDVRQFGGASSTITLWQSFIAQRHVRCRGGPSTDAMYIYPCSRMGASFKIWCT